MEAVLQVLAETGDARQADEAEEDDGEAGHEARPRRAHETLKTPGGESGGEEVWQSPEAERGHHGGAAERAARHQRRREDAVDEAAGDPPPGKTNRYCSRARIRGREARAQARESTPQEPAGPLQREHRGTQPRQRETQENHEGVGDDEQKDSDGKQIAVEQSEPAQSAGERAGAGVARDPSEAVGELPANAWPRRAQVERRDDAAAHRDAVNSSRQSDHKRGHEESGQPCDNNSRRVHRPVGVFFSLEEGDLPSPTPEEKARMADAPKGTFVLMMIIAVLLFAGWAALYFGRFLGNGPVR